ncbi:MAG: ABC transporter ATP-binding protein [Nitratiruptor sp.]|nr:ABC transporter ATP-binding protein [Nitratiruptor sp.]NPA83050.1 ABC transporter ATP-binding protein [Campylobacterota bacterium]
MGAPLLEGVELGHSFDYELFEGLSFQLHEGESMAVVGKSGSGKSTLLHICSTLLPPRSGEVYLFQEPIYRLSKERLLSLRRYKVGIIFQSHYLFKGFTARENIEVAALMVGRSLDLELIQRFRIAHLLEKKVSELSGGEQQRVSIARVLTKEPKIIFADEPTGNLDSQTAQEVMDWLFEYVRLRKGGLFLVTHDMELAYRCDKVYRLEGKGLVGLRP